MPDRRPTAAVGKDVDDAGTQATLQKGGAVRMMGVRIQEQLLGDLGETAQHMDNPPPATKRGRAPVCFSPSNSKMLASISCFDFCC